MPGTLKRLWITLLFGLTLFFVLTTVAYLLGLLT